MNFTTDYWQKVGLLVVGAVLTVLGTLFVWQWTSADVRYGTGGAYISSTLAISSLGLRNMGHADAENVTNTASFADPLTDISTGQLATPFDISAGGAGQKVVTGTIKRIVPDEIVNVYFVTKPSSPWSNYSQFIQGIKFNGGKGKTGTPWLYGLPSFLLGVVVAGVIIAGLSYWARKDRRSFNNRLVEAIQLGASARQEGVSSEQLNTRVENFHQALSFLRKSWKDTLIACAQAALTEVRQEDKLKP